MDLYFFPKHNTVQIFIQLRHWDILVLARSQWSQKTRLLCGWKERLIEKHTAKDVCQKQRTTSLSSMRAFALINTIHINEELGFLAEVVEYWGRYVVFLGNRN